MIVNTGKNILPVDSLCFFVSDGIITVGRLLRFKNHRQPGNRPDRRHAMDRLTIEITPALAGRTVGSLLRTELRMTGGQISSAKFRENGILLSGRRVRVAETVRAGEVLSVSIADQGGNHADPADIDIPVVWEDDCFAVLDKPAGITVHGAVGPSVAAFLASKWGNNVQFHPVNRLDVGTSGLMIAAKSGYMHERLRRLLHTDAFIREYLALAEGSFPEARGSITLPVSRRAGPDRRHTADPDGLPCRTDYEMISQYGRFTLLRLRLFTGRTHQIRVHLSAAGHPIAGDTLYGAPEAPIGRPALHSYRIRLIHPMTGETITFTSRLPQDMQRLITSAGFTPDHL